MRSAGCIATRRSNPDRSTGPRETLQSFRVAKTNPHVSETPATAWLRQHGVVFTEHVYAYVEHSGSAESARQLGVEEHAVIKTLVMQDERAAPLIVLMHGDQQVSTKDLARCIGVKSVQPCTPEAAQRHSGYQVGGTSPFGVRKSMPVFVEASVLALARICINGGRRGYLVGIEPRILVDVLRARPVNCARSVPEPARSHPQGAAWPAQAWPRVKRIS